MSDPTPEERAQGAYEVACLRREALGKDMIRSPGPAQTQRIFVTEIAHAIRTAEASALRRAADHEFHVPEPERYDEAGVDWTDNHWREWLRAEADRIERSEK